MNKQKSRSVFDASFKRQVAQTVKVQGLSISQVCGDMELAESAVRRWVAQLKAEQLGQNGIGKPFTAEHRAPYAPGCQQEVERLAFLVHREVKIFSNAFDPNTGVVHAAITAYRAFMFAKNFRKQRQKLVRPAVDRQNRRAPASFPPSGNSSKDRSLTRMTSIKKRISLIAGSAFYPRREKVLSVDEQAIRPLANATEQ